MIWQKFLCVLFVEDDEPKSELVEAVQPVPEVPQPEEKEEEEKPEGICLFILKISILQRFWIAQIFLDHIQRPHNAQKQTTQYKT